MAGITQKSCVALFSLWSLKKKISVSVFGGRRWSRCESTKTHTKNQSQNLIRSHLIRTSLMINIKIAIIIIEITKNDYHNNNNSNNNNKSNDNSI